MKIEDFKIGFLKFPNLNQDVRRLDKIAKNLPETFSKKHKIYLNEFKTIFEKFGFKATIEDLESKERGDNGDRIDLNLYYQERLHWAISTYGSVRFNDYAPPENSLGLLYCFDDQHKDEYEDFFHFSEWRSIIKYIANFEPKN